MAWLKEQDIPMPLDYDDVKFDLDESGAIVAWTEYAIVETV